jgi:hypothetical protein
MKPKSFILGAICIAIFAKANAQVDSFNLSNYKLPVLKRQQLDFNFNFSGNNSYNKHLANNSSNYAESQSNSYDGTFALFYKLYNNNIKWQNEAQVGINISPNYNSSKIDSIHKYESYGFTPRININSINRNYFLGSIFFETDMDLYFSMEKDFNKEDDLNTNQNVTIGAITIPLKIGQGRIEQVQDARHAIYIIDELKKQNRLSNIQTNDDIIKFADFIAEVKNKRFFDARIKKIYEIEAIDSFLFANGFAQNRDARYFTTLNDYWNYGGGPLRNTGTRYSLCIYPGYYYNHYKYSDNVNTNEYRINSLLIYGGIEIVHEKPINLFWQSTSELNCYFGTTEGKLKMFNFPTNLTERFPNFQLALKQEIGYYPNTRTELTWQVSGKYVKLFDKEDLINNINGAEGQGIKLTSVININYYISPRFRLNFNSSLDYRWQDSKDKFVLTFDDLNSGQSNTNQLYANQYYYTTYNPKTFNHQFSIALIYSIF